MDARELRIGNWVLDEQGQSIQICVKHFNWVNDLTPIPITPEILEKAGFKKSIELVGGFLYYEDNSKEDFDIALIDGIATLQVESCNYGKPFKYLHQLQNIFYSLTGEELQINLSE
jgi:hypothetical protein